MQYDDHVSKKICLVVSCLIPIHCFAQLPQDSRRAGGIAIIPLTANTTQVFYEQNSVLITQEQGQRKDSIFVRVNNLDWWGKLDV